MVCAAAFCVLYLDSTSKWWFEDDPTHFASAAAVRNPIAFFVDPQVMRRWGTGASLVPMHALSYWCDLRIFGVSAAAARVHSLVSTVLVCTLLFLCLTRYGADPRCSAVAAVLWLFLPATIAVHDYIGPRHYLEGLGWSLAACLVLHRICREPPGAPAWRDGALLLIFTVAAMLSKETYVATLPALLVLYGASRRRYWPGVMAAVLVIGYAWYRTAMLGPNAVYPQPAWNLGEYARSLWVLPYTFAAGSAGWAYYVGLAAFAAWAFSRDPRPVTKCVVLLLAVYAAGLVAAYPTAAALLLTHETPGTWYRAAFVPSTIALIAGAYMLGRWANRKVQLAALLIFVAIVAPGTQRTRAYWNRRLARSEVEGRFYLAHPDRLVYSEEEAYWFLPGLDRLYGVGRPHSVDKYAPTDPGAASALARFSTIWRQQDGAWTEDSALYARLRTQSADGRRPVIP